MKKWLYDRPWIWIVLLLALLMAGSIATLVIAELNKPEIIKRSSARSEIPLLGTPIHELPTERG